MGGGAGSAGCGGVGGWGRKRGVGGEVEVRERAVAQRCDAQAGDARPIVDGPCTPALTASPHVNEEQGGQQGSLEVLSLAGMVGIPGACGGAQRVLVAETPQYRHLRSTRLPRHTSSPAPRQDGHQTTPTLPTGSTHPTTDHRHATDHCHAAPSPSLTAPR